jgi:ABC-2 type transport system permease protein
MSRLFAALGVDYDQWKALTKTALRIDLRVSRLGAAQFGRVQARAAAILIGQFFFYSAMGVAVALAVWFTRDLFLASMIVLSYVMFMIATAALLDHNAAIASPDDHAILGFRPVTSRTYFAARLANVFVYTTAMTTVFSYMPIVAFFVRYGAGVGIAAIIAIAAASTATALTMIVGYAWLMRVVGPQRLKRVLSYVQFLLSFVVYGGYFMMSRLFQVGIVARLELPKSPWLLLLPPAWFASYLEVAAGRVSLLEILPILASVVVLAVLAVMLGGRLSLEYADRLAALTTVSAQVAPPRPSRRGFLFTRDEARAVALLIRSQFRNDMKFRMGVLAIVPLTIVYLAMGLHDGGIGDPFDEGGAGQGMSMITIAVMMFPTMLKLNLARSDAYRASWIFFASPSDRARIVQASKNILVVTFLLPYLTIVGILLAYFATNIAHLIVHLLVMVLVSHLVLQLVTFVEPELPFSRPLAKGSSSSRVFVIMIFAVAAGTSLPHLAPLVYRSTAATAAGIATLVLISVMIDRFTRLRVEAQASRLEFEG